jgi:hypothetical protein
LKVNLLIGVLVGLADFALLYGMRLAGMLRSELGGRLLLLTLFTHVLGLIVAMVRLRKSKDGSGFPRLLAAGLSVSFFAAVTAGLSVLFFLQVVDPGYLDWVVESTRQSVASWPQEQRAVALEQLANTTPLAYASRGAAVSYLLRGLLLSLLLASVLRLRMLRGTELGEP